MRTKIDNTTKCDVAGCNNPVVYECGCDRCDREPSADDRFHACEAHPGLAGEIHVNNYGRDARWWRGPLVPPSAFNGWWAEGGWKCECETVHAATHLACRHCHNTRPPLATALPERVSRGFYRHYKGDTYFVVGVGTLNEHGHGDLGAPRQVVYESTRSVDDRLLRLRSEAEFTGLIEWPDGIVRPRFVRVKS